jgi:hypothetical protein
MLSRVAMLGRDTMLGRVAMPLRWDTARRAGPRDDMVCRCVGIQS